MKKRVLSLFMALALSFSMTPAVAFAEEAGAVTEQEAQSGEGTADVYTTGEETIGNETPSNETIGSEMHGNDVSDVSGGDVSGGDAGQDAAVQAAQALIDALPDEVTAENADELQSQLIAIDKAMEALDEAQLAKLDMARYYAICTCTALTTFVAAQNGGHTNHPICGTTCTGHEDSHAAVTDWTPLSYVDGKLMKNGVEWKMKDGDHSYELETGNYYLETDIEIVSYTPPENNQNLPSIKISGYVSLCLNGHNITQNNGVCAIRIPNGSNRILSLCDCASANTENGYITSKTSSGVSFGTSSFNMYGGIIKNCSLAGVNGYGTFNMYGGTITKNATGVVVGGNSFGGTFNMYDGKITANTQQGVCINVESKFNMSGGEISGNKATNGGGVYINCANSKYVGTEFNMSGGEISGNKATNGGGVYVWGDSTHEPKFTMSGGEISGNEADTGGGVYVGSYGTFTMSGGEITGNNTADNSKTNGNVYVYTAAFHVSGKAKIHDNWINGKENNETGVYDEGDAGIAGNVYICPVTAEYFSYININEGLTEDASIGVTTKAKPSDGTPVQFATSASSDLNYTKIFKSDATDTTGTPYDVYENGGNLYLRLHEHSWNFEKSSTQSIRAVCGVDGTKGGSVTIQGPTGNMAYDGNPKAAKLINNTLPDGVKAPEISYTMGDGANNSLPAGSEPTNAGKYTASITLTGVDGKSATASVSYTIGKATPTAADFTVSAPENLVYDNEYKYASVTSNTIEQDKLSVSYYGEQGKVGGNVLPKDAGTYTVEIEVNGSQNYKDISGLTSDDWTFTIKPAKPIITVPNKSPVILKNGSEVDISKWASFNNTDSGAKLNYELVDTPTGITLAGNKLKATSAASAGSSFTIKVTAAKTANFTVPDAKSITVTVVDKYDAGVSIMDAPAVTYGDEFTLTATKNEGTPDDGKWSWSSSDEEILEIVSKGDTATPTIRAKKADTTGATLTATYSCETHEGTATTLFIPVTQKAVSADMIGEISAQTYTGNDIEPTSVIIKDGSHTLESGKDFTFSYDKNCNAGTATLIITGMGNYMGTASKTFTIAPKSIDGATITLVQDRFDYDGSVKTVSIDSVTLSGIQLAADTDYVVEEGSNKATDAGYIILTINGTGNYTGTATTTWTIDRIRPIWSNFTCNFAGQQTYDGTAKVVTVEVADGIKGMGNITVKYSGSETAPIDAGSYTVTADVTRGTNYNAESFAIGTLTINPADAPELKDIEVSYRFTLTGEKTVSVAELVAGASNYMPGTPTGATGIIEDLSVNADGVVKYTLTGKGAIGDKVTLPVTIQSKNYKDATVMVVITLTEKDNQEPLTIIGGDVVAYDQKLKLGTTGGSGTGAVTYSIEAGDGDAIISADGVLTPLKAGFIVIRATKAGDAEYNEITSDCFEILITQAATTGEPKYTKITIDGKTLADAGLTLDGSTLSPAAGTLEWVDEEGKVLSGDTGVKVNTTYKWRFTPEGGNYKTLTGEVELYHVDAPAISTQPVNTSVKAGERAVFEVAATGTDLKYQWKINRNDGNGFVNISGADSASYTSGITDTDCNGFQYYCVISNAAGTVTTDTVTLTVTVEYEILDGAGSSWTENTDGSLAIRGSGAIAKFLRVLVDGTVVDPSNYTVTEGSTIITFKPEFLKTLPEGSHTFELVWTDGTASTSFTVAKNTSGNNDGNNNNGNNNSNNNSNNDGSSNNAGSNADTTDTTIKAPKTGDTSNDALWVVLLAVASVAGLSGFAEILVRRKKSDCK